MKKIACALLALLVCLAACGAKTEGLLTGEEIAKYESLYFSETGELLEKLGLAQEDLTAETPAPGLWTLKATRTVDGNGFRQALLVSETEPAGLYGVRLFTASISHDRAAELAQSLYGKAVELYGAPATYPGLEGRLSEDFQSGMESWDVGEKTTFTLRLTSAGSLDGEADMDIVELSYQVSTVRDGQMVDPVTQMPAAR